MKIKYKGAFRGEEFNNVEQAIIDAVTPNAYSYETQKDKLRIEVEKLREMLARIMECVFNEERFPPEAKKEALEYILGYGYEVTE